jgi:hypothetical protein
MTLDMLADIQTLAVGDDFSTLEGMGGVVVITC